MFDNTLKMHINIGHCIKRTNAANKALSIVVVLDGVELITKLPERIDNQTLATQIRKVKSYEYKNFESERIDKRNTSNVLIHDNDILAQWP